MNILLKKQYIAIKVAWLRMNDFLAEADATTHFNLY